MTDIARLITDMVSEGVSAEIIGRVAAALAERKPVLLKDDQAERRRMADRERKQRLRNSAESADSNEAKKEIPPTPPKEKNIYITPESSNELSAPKRSRRKPETPLPVDFPTAEQTSEAETRAEAAGVKLNIKHQANQFRANAQTNDRRCRDWSAAWRMWVGKAIEWAGGRADGEPPPQAPPRADLIRAYRHSGTWPSEWGERPTPEELAA